MTKRRDLPPSAAPVTQILLSSVPSPDPGMKREKRILAGDVPSPVNPLQPDVVSTPDVLVMDRCKVEEPQEIRVSATHRVWCHLVEAAVIDPRQ